MKKSDLFLVAAWALLALIVKVGGFDGVDDVLGPLAAGLLAVAIYFTLQRIILIIRKK